MKLQYYQTSLITFVHTAALLSAQPIVDMVPASRLAEGVKLKIKQIKWNADCQWMGKKAPVCQSTTTLKDPKFAITFAEKYKLTRIHQNGALEPLRKGVISYKRPKTYMGSYVEPDTHYTVISLKQVTYKQDKKYQPVINNIPNDEKALKIALKWLPFIGVNEKDLYHLAENPAKLLVRIGHHHVGGNDPETLKPYSKKYGIELTFSQQIGGLAADWNGFGGRVKIDIIDEGEFAIARHCLRPWKIMGHYPVLSKKEIEEALRGDFHWCFDPQPCETLEITKIRLEAYCAQHDKPQRHFPLIYYIEAKPLNAPAGTPVMKINIPALKMHRHLYGAKDKEPSQKTTPTAP